MFNAMKSANVSFLGGGGGRIYRLSIRLLKRLHEREDERDPFLETLTEFA
jgi:hypothetical protein